MMRSVGKIFFVVSILVGTFIFFENFSNRFFKEKSDFLKSKNTNLVEERFNKKEETGKKVLAKCGTEHLLRTFSESKKSKRTLASNCPPENYYDSVYLETTPHFAFFYTASGPHAVEKKFLDSAKIAFERAYDLLTKTHGTLSPKGLDTSYHYRKKVPENLYPIEIVEINLVRNLSSLVGNCDFCFAITLPEETHSGRSEILLENDFQFSFAEEKKAFFEKDSATCPYFLPDTFLINRAHHYSYAEHFGKALRITAAHELYHAVQTRYLSFWEHPTYWLEASASGIEEIASPEVDDYWEHAHFLFEMRWKSFDEIYPSYALSPLFLLLYGKFGPKFDTKIWESFKKNPSEPFENHLASAFSFFGENPDDAFLELAIALFFSGKRNSAMKNSPEDSLNSPFSAEDAPFWESPRILNETETFSNQFPSFAYQSSKNFPEGLSGHFSFLIRNKNDSSYQKIPIQSEADYRKSFSQIHLADTSILVFSKLLEKDSLQKEVRGKKLFAFPNPWRGGPLCFENLPEKKVLEIRTRSGALAFSTFPENQSLCLDEKSLNPIAPGLYYYRAGRRGRTHKLLIIK